MLQSTRTLKQLMLAIAIVIVGLAGAPASAETAVAASPEIVLTDAEQAMIADNPALQELSDSVVLRQALDLIAAALKQERTGRGGLGGLEREDVELLGRNPALLQVWQSSPEASADLLALIRAAAGSGKSQK
jgi:hypothetical protein